MRTFKDEMWIWQNKALTTLNSIKLIPIAYFYAERGHEKRHIFSVTLQIDPYLVWRRFFGNIFDFYK